jgi:pantothenate kinase
MFDGFEELVCRIRSLKRARSIVAIAGPPGGGKSTLSENLVEAINKMQDGSAAIVPMDGFHYDNSVLSARGLMSRKGSPPTFDTAGFSFLLDRLRKNEEDEVAVPVFDRALNLSRAGARVVTKSVQIVITEGNYLLLDSQPWVNLRPLFDLTVMVREDSALLEKRLVNRWLSYGFDIATARGKVFDNDLPNVDLVLSSSGPCQVVVKSIEA